MFQQRAGRPGGRLPGDQVTENKTHIDMTVLGAERTASEQDQQLLTRAQALLRSDPHFQALKTPALSRAELNAGQPDTEAGYLYLRFDVAGALPQEFWAYWGAHDRVAWKSGQVCVGPGQTSTAPKAT